MTGLITLKMGKFSFLPGLGVDRIELVPLITWFHSGSLGAGSSNISEYAILFFRSSEISMTGLRSWKGRGYWLKRKDRSGLNTIATSILPFYSMSVASSVSFTHCTRSTIIFVIQYSLRHFCHVSRWRCFIFDFEEETVFQIDES